MVEIKVRGRLPIEDVAASKITGGELPEAFLRDVARELLSQLVNAGVVDVEYTNDASYQDAAVTFKVRALEKGERTHKGVVAPQFKMESTYARY